MIVLLESEEGIEPIIVVQIFKEIGIQADGIMI